MRKGYDQAADMWSVGCIIYLLLSGNLPFMGRSQKELFRKIVAGTFDFDDEEWVDISDDAKDLVRKLLIMNPDERITANDAVRHKWLKASRDRLSMITLQGTSQRLKTFNARMKLRSAMIAVDWISSLKRMQWMSTRKLNSSASDSDAGGSPSPMLAAARKKKAKEAEENGEKPAAGTGNALLNAAKSMKTKEAGTAEASTNSAGKRNILSAAKAMKAMQLKEGEE
jgi:serine/threonine protein kinase